MSTPNPIIKTIDLGDGKPVTIETGKLAKQADGSVIVRQGNTMLLGTVVANTENETDIGYFPLSCDYREKFAGAGRIPGNFFKREARPSDSEVLASRLIDRPLRPLFPDDFMFSGGISEIRSQIGEAVPPLLALRIAEELLQIL